MLNEARQGGFAPAGFADNAENLPTLHVKGHPVHGFALGLDGLQDAATYREVFAQCPDRQNRLARLRRRRAVRPLAPLRGRRPFRAFTLSHIGFLYSLTSIASRRPSLSRLKAIE